MNDPTKWLGDPITSLLGETGNLYVNVPPATRDVVVISVLDAPSPYEPPIPAGKGQNNGYVKLSLASALTLRQGLDAASHSSKSTPDHRTDGSRLTAPPAIMSNG